MNDWSIFSASTGNRCRWASEEYPVPKSSIAMRTPSCFSAVSRRAVTIDRLQSVPPGSPGLGPAVTLMLGMVGEAGRPRVPEIGSLVAIDRQADEGYCSQQHWHQRRER
jgi:hypothetical protein